MDLNKIRKNVEDLLRSSNVNLGRETKKREGFIQEVLNTISNNKPNTKPRKNRKKIPNSDAVLCLKPKEKNKNQKGGFVMTKSRSQKLDDMRGNG